jgi:hypothetical protein
MKFSKINLVDAEHRFHSIEEERRIELVEMLKIIVFFAPAEYSLKGK